MRNVTSSRARRDQPPAGGTVRFAGLAAGAGGFVLLVAAAAVVAVIVGAAATAAPEAVGIDDPGLLVRFGIPVSRLLLDLSAVVVAGIGMLPKLIGFDDPRRSEPVLVRTRTPAVVAAVIWTVSALLALVLLTAELGAAPTPAGVWSYIVGIPAGKGLLLSAGCGALSIWLARLAVKHGEKVPAELRAGVALFGLLPLPLTGHASNWRYHDLSMILMELHVVTAVAWTGGLAAVIVFLSRSPALLAVALPRFSKLATWCVIVVGVTGIFNGLLELALSPVTSLPGSLLTTRYGVLVVAKAVCMAVIAALAVVVRTRLLPRVAAGRPTALAVWCGWEVTILAVAFAVAVVLTRTSVTPF